MAGRDFVIPDLQDGDPCPDCGTPLRIGFGPQLRRNLRALIELPAVIVISLLKIGVYSPPYEGTEGDRLVRGRDIHDVECPRCHRVHRVLVRTWLGPARL